jgi:hypothetical protein
MLDSKSTYNINIMSVTPKNITIEENTISVEFNDHQWYYKGAIVSLIKNIDKIVWTANVIGGLREKTNNDCFFRRTCDDATNVLLLNYNEEEKFTITLNKKISTTTIEKTDTPTKIFGLTILSELKEKTISTNTKINDYQKKINECQKIINEYNNEIDTLNKDMIESKILAENIINLFKYECGLQISSSDKLMLLSKEFITTETFMAELTTSNIDNLIRSNVNELKKLITEKKFNINAKNKDEKTLLEITLNNHETFAIFLLENDIDISPSVENDIKISGTSKMNEAYFNNAKRNNHIDLLVKNLSDIKGLRLTELVNEYVKSNPTTCPTMSVDSPDKK